VSRRFALLAAAALVSGGLSAVASADPSPAAIQHRNVPACPAPPAGYAHCHAVLHQAVTADGAPAPNAASPTGLSPGTIKAAYNFGTSNTAGAGKTIAIVDAYDAPNIESDLSVFSNQFGLPACTTANGCFKKVNQSGGTNYPRVDSGWALEIALDVEWAHAVAPGAKILLVEASSASFTNLLIAEDYAKTHGAQYVSNSWGAPEFSSETSYDAHFSQSGVTFFVSSGDNGTPAEYPSSSHNVVSVGGTTLAIDGANITETGWSGSGGGCSLYESPPSGQSTGSVNCAGKRGTPDISLDADPNTGVSVYDSTSTGGQSGWFRVGGTSASSPMVAAASAVAAASGLTTISGPGSVYATFPHYDVIAGNNGAAAGTGYDLVTGVGSWNNGVARVDPTGGGGGGGSGSTVAAHLVSATITGASRGKGIIDTVLVGDASNNPIAGANITVTISGGGTTATGSATTGSNGTVAFKYSKGSCGTSYTTTLTAASGTDSNGNSVILDSSNLSKSSSCA
jgi:subtilase family serine protease